MHSSFFLCAGHLIISQSLRLMEKGKWWEHCLTAANETERNRWCVAVDQAAFCLARPPTTWDQGQSSTASHSWDSPHCHREHIRSKWLPQHRSRQSIGMKIWTVCVCFIIHHIWRKMYSSVTSGGNSGLCFTQALIILWYIYKLTSALSSLVTFHAYRKENTDKWGSGSH